MSFSPTHFVASTILVLVLVSCGTGSPNDLVGDGSPMSDAAPGNAPGAPLAVTVEAIPVESVVTMIAGSDTQGGVVNGTGTQARFRSPQDLAVDGAGNVYIAEISSSIRRLSPSTGAVSTFATLPRVSATGIALDSAGNAYVKAGTRVYKISGGEPISLAGSDTEGNQDGQGSAAAFQFQGGTDLDTAGNVIVADFQNHRIRQVTPAGVVSTLAGSTSGPADGAAATAQFRFPGDVARDHEGNIYIADYLNARVRKLSGSTVSTLAGSGAHKLVDGVGAKASFLGPRGIAVDRAGNVYVADLAGNGGVRRITPAGAVTTVASGIPYARSVAVDSAGNVYVGNGSNVTLPTGAIRKITSVGIGELKVTWQAPTSELPISGYAATATAGGHDNVTCSSTGELTCTLQGLVTGVAYDVTVTATSDAGSSFPSSSTSATPN